ncbi:MAG: HPr family phosphocarrier protein [Desulfuromonadaceae bacterium]|nr:HPr family phosphocarrier protein [Desulfuromonadaceae bacterium]
MEKENLVIINRLGLHARAAAQLVKAANCFESNIMIEKDGSAVDGKSIMSILMLAAQKGSVISVSADGRDEKEALAAIKDLVGNGFGED